MIGSSREFQTTIRESHKVISRAVVLYNGTPQTELAITDGNVRIDSGNKHRRTADLTISDPTGTLVPNDITDLLHPLSGNEVAVYRGAYVPALGENEEILLGVFPIKDCEITDSGANRNISLKLIDRSLRLSKARATEPMVLWPGFTVAETIAFGARLKWPNVQLAEGFEDFRPWILMPPGVIDRTTDLWDAFVKWALDAGAELIFNNEGYLTLRPLPQGDPTQQDVVWEFAEGELSTMLSLRRDITQDNTFNKVVAYSQPTDGSPPVSGTVEISGSHPLSVTGPMGEVPFFYSSNFLQTPEQATLVAYGLLFKHAGHTEHVHFNSLVNPCSEDADVVSIVRSGIGVNSYYSLDNITLPLTALRAMECDTREKFIAI